MKIRVHLDNEMDIKYSLVKGEYPCSEFIDKVYVSSTYDTHGFYFEVVCCCTRETEVLEHDHSTAVPKKKAVTPFWSKLRFLHFWDPVGLLYHMVKYLFSNLLFLG